MQRRAGVIRFAAFRPGKSAAWCTVCRKHLALVRPPATGISARAAGKAARDHTRDTGHETHAWHTQIVTYRRDES